MLKPGSTGRMKSGTEGWIRVTVLDYSDILRSMSRPGHVVTRGGVEEYQVRFEEGKHKGEVRWVPANYIEAAQTERTPGLYVATAESREEYWRRNGWRYSP